jgi:hypothetical protein
MSKARFNTGPFSLRTKIYTTELQKLYEIFVNGKDMKLTVADAKNDLLIYDIKYKK